MKKTRFKRRLNTRIVFILIVTIGLGLLNYPYLSGIVNTMMAHHEEQAYIETIEKTDTNEMDEKIEKATKYNQDLFAHNNMESYTDFDMTSEGYFYGYLDVPQINLYTAVRYSTTETVLKSSLGIVTSGSLPVGGKSTHSIISGHTGMASKKGLTDLTQIVLGDIFFLHMFGQDMAYQVDQIVVVEPWDNKDLAIEKDKDYVTLLTCTPYGVNDHRLLVRGTRIDYDFTTPAATTAEPEVRVSDVEQTRIYIAIGSGIVYVLIIGYAVVNTIIDYKKYKKKKEEDKKNEEKSKLIDADTHSDDINNADSSGGNKDGTN